MQDQGLWDRIRAFEIDDPESSFRFSDRLAKENLWTKEFALQAIEEYKTFMYLGITNGPVTPSIAIDQCWHLHMIYSRSYWDFCQVLGMYFHHGPTKGGDEEDNKYKAQYYRTLFLREGLGPIPKGTWESNSDRWKPCDIRSIDLATHWVVPTRDVKAIFKILIKEIKLNAAYHFSRCGNHRNTVRRVFGR